MITFPAILKLKRNRAPANWVQNTNHTFIAGSDIYRVAYGSDGYWVMVGQATGVVNYIQTNPTGTWSEPTYGFTSGYAWCVTYDGTNWCVGGTGGKFRYKASPPSGSWSDGTTNPGTITNYGVDYGSSNWCVGASAGHIYYKSSVSGAWSTATESITGDTKDLTYGSDGYWVIVGTGDCFATASGVPSTFTNRTSPFTAGKDAYCCAYDGSTYWVAGSNEGAIGYSSDHGATWTKVSTPGDFLATDTIYGVAYGKGYWTIVGSSGKLATATNPTASGNWTAQTSSFGTTSIFGVAYGAGYWVAVGDGKMAYSKV